jgi:hypothetical protein
MGFRPCGPSDLGDSLDTLDSPPSGPGFFPSFRLTCLPHRVRDLSRPGRRGKAGQGHGLSRPGAPALPEDRIAASRQPQRSDPVGANDHSPLRESYHTRSLRMSVIREPAGDLPGPPLPRDCRAGRDRLGRHRHRRLLCLPEQTHARRVRAANGRYIGPPCRPGEVRRPGKPRHSSIPAGAEMAEVEVRASTRMTMRR